MKIDQKILMMWLIDRWDKISTTVGTIEARVSWLISNLKSIFTRSSVPPINPPSKTFRQAFGDVVLV